MLAGLLSKPSQVELELFTEVDDSEMNRVFDVRQNVLERNLRNSSCFPSIMAHLTIQVFGCQGNNTTFHASLRPQIKSQTSWKTGFLCCGGRGRLDGQPGTLAPYLGLTN